MTGKLACALVAAVVVTAGGPTDEAPYVIAGRLPNTADRQALNRLEFDAVARRLYAPTRKGVYWMDLRSTEPRLSGPVLFERPDYTALAPDRGRLYVANDDTLAFLDVRGTAPPTGLAHGGWRGRLVYEPTRHELYASVRVMSNRTAIYNADTGALVTELTLPGVGVSLLHAVPGKVFVRITDEFGLYAIDAATRTVSPWLVDGQRVDPLRFFVEHSGRVMIAQYERHLVAIDVPSARTLARLPAIGLQTFAFDPDHRRVVVAIQDPPDHPRVHLRVYALGIDGFTFLSELENPTPDIGWLTSTADGFVQRTRQELVFWKAQAVAR